MHEQHRASSPSEDNISDNEYLGIAQEAAFGAVMLAVDDATAAYMLSTADSPEDSATPTRTCTASNEHVGEDSAATLRATFLSAPGYVSRGLGDESAQRCGSGQAPALDWDGAHSSAGDLARIRTQLVRNERFDVIRMFAWDRRYKSTPGFLSKGPRFGSPRWCVPAPHDARGGGSELVTSTAGDLARTRSATSQIRNKRFDVSRMFAGDRRYNSKPGFLSKGPIFESPRCRPTETVGSSSNDLSFHQSSKGLAGSVEAQRTHSGTLQPDNIQPSDGDDTRLAKTVQSLSPSMVMDEKILLKAQDWTRMFYDFQMLQRENVRKTPPIHSSLLPPPLPTKPPAPFLGKMHNTLRLYAALKELTLSLLKDEMRQLGLQKNRDQENQIIELQERICCLLADVDRLSQDNALLKDEVEGKV